MHRIPGMFLLSVMVAGAALADTHTWVGGHSSGGGWNVAANWQNENGENEVPEAGDTALFNEFITNVVTDADLGVFNALARVRLDAYAYNDDYGVALVLDVTQDPVDVKPSINGAGCFIKRGTNRANLVSVNEDGISSPYGRYGVYNINGGGIEVKEGTLSLIQTTVREYLYNKMTIDSGATVCVPTNGPVTITALFGSGTLVNEDTRANPSKQTLSIHYFLAYAEPNGGDFSGKITGPIEVTVNGRQAFSGVESDFTGNFTSQYGDEGGYEKKYSWAFLKKFGNKNEPSSAGKNGDIYLMYGGSLGYIGDGAPEETDRGICSEARKGTGLWPQCLDAGTNGNLTINGSIYLYPSGSEYNMRSFVFGGSNAAPCTVAGPFCLNMGTDYDYNFYVRKEGPGVWQFKENASTSFKGVFDVREGTLRFDTMAPKGLLSALGFSTQLTDEFKGVYDASHDSPYAFRVGTTSPSAAPAVFEFNGMAAGCSTDRPMLLTGDATIRANGRTDGAALTFGDVRAQGGAVTLTLDGTNTADNALYELQNGDGTVSLVKDGSGTWNLSGNQTFSGSLTVKAGTLVVNGPRPYTWFRFIMTAGYGNRHGGYIAELALYDADGNRRNLDLTFQMPAGKDWGQDYYPTEKEDQSLAEGSITVSLPGDYYYLYDNHSAVNACDGTTSVVEFARAMDGFKNTVLMHLTNGSEVVSVDFVQDNGCYDAPDGCYQTPSAFVLQGSVDGKSWETLVTQENLPHRDAQYWYYSTDDQMLAETGRANRKLADGQGLAFTNPAREAELSVLTNLGAVAVAAGSTLRTSGLVSPKISTLSIDGKTGAGVISGFLFDENMTVDVTGIERFTGGELRLPVDFTGIANFDSVRTWTFKQDGASESKYDFRLTKTELVIRKRGFVLTVR